MTKINHTTLKGKLGNEIYVEDIESGEYTAFFSDFPEIVTQGETIDKAQTNLWNAVHDILQNFLKDI